MLDSGDYAHVFMVKECDKNSGNRSGSFANKNKHTISKWPLSDTNLIYILAYEIHILDPGDYDCVLMVNECDQNSGNSSGTFG